MVSRAKQRFAVWVDESGCKPSEPTKGTLRRCRFRMTSCLPKFGMQPNWPCATWTVTARRQNITFIFRLFLAKCNSYPSGIHGAYLRRWRDIQRWGLKPMGRSHIHFVPHQASVLVHFACVSAFCMHLFSVNNF